MSTRRHDAHLSSRSVDRLLAGEVTSLSRAQYEAHLATCARCRSDVAEAQKAQRDFVDVVMPRTLARVRSRLLPSRKARWAWLGGVATAAAALVLFVGSRPRPEPDLMTKGGPSLRLVSRRDGRLFPVQDGSHLRAGDELRFVVTAAPQPYLMVASIDGDGNATIYYPFAGAVSAGLDAKAQRVELPGSIILDGARGPERVFALFSDAPLAGADVRKTLVSVGERGASAIRDTTRLPIEASAQLTVIFEKDPP